jgi:hypothetical protein
VKIEIVRANSSEDTFAGTTQVVIRLDYLECLHDFYTASHTEWAQSGQKGGPVFEEWAERLCDPDDADGTAIPACTVSAISQNLGAAGAATSLRVTYDVQDTDLNLAVFRFGPLPVESLTDGCAPMVQLDVGSVRGFDATNQVIWGIESFTAFNEGETNQSGELRVNVSKGST